MCITSRYAYQFVCIYVHIYIKRNNSNLHVNVCEHISKWLQKQVNPNRHLRTQDKQISFSIASHLSEIIGSLIPSLSIDLVIY